tara:strand:+ start:1195 stop:1431 length:237 start_codon:yes stop_codon:yes gene_type:complete
MAEISIKVNIPDESKEEFNIALNKLIEKASNTKSHLSDRERFESIVSKSKLTEEDARELSDNIKEGMWKEFKKEFPRL